MNKPAIMDRCLECIGLLKLPGTPVPEHLEPLGKARLDEGSEVMCYACTTCGLRWVHDELNGWRQAATLDAANEAKRALSLARFADSILRS